MATIADSIADSVDEQPTNYSTETPAAEAAESTPRPALTVSGAAVGRRKQAIARVRVVPGTGKIIVNGRELDEYFPNKLHQHIIGAGPAGLSAGLYASRAKLKTLLIEKSVDGGQIVGTNDVENYPGAPEDTTGPSLIERMSQQAKDFGVERAYEEVVDVDLNSNPKIVKTTDNEYEAKTIIIATGARPKKINCPGEDEFAGRGISYCATCDGPFSEGLHTYVVGGGDAAVEEAIFLTKFASKVTIIHRRDSLRAAKSIQEKAFNNEKIDFLWDSQIIEVKGDKLIESFTVKNIKTGEETVITPDENQKRLSLFVFIGYNPNTQLFSEKLNLAMDYILTNENMETEIPGVYAAGDVRVKNLRQVVTATSDGAIAAVTAEKYIESFDI